MLSINIYILNDSYAKVDMPMCVYIRTDIHKHHFQVCTPFTHTDTHTHSHIQTFDVELVTAQPAEVLQAKSSTFSI